MKKITYLFLAVLLIIGCKKEKADNTWNGVAGHFSLGLTTNLKSTKVLKSDASVNFDLDTVKSSRSFYFILGNIGENDINNVSLSLDNSNFSITPSKIQILPGTKNKTGSTLIQIITLDAVHGTRINGVGYTGLLSAGDNYCNITIEGQTADGESNISTAIKAKVKVFAKVMAIALYQGSSEYDLTKPVGKVLGGPFDVSQANYYNYTDLPVSLKNIGNVRIHVILAGLDINNPILQNTFLNPLQTMSLNLHAPSVSNSFNYEVQLNSDGIIFDQQKLSLGNDGNGYFSLSCIPLGGGGYNPPHDSIANH